MTSLGPVISVAAAWSAVSQVGRHVLQFITVAILARLLSPSDFGLLGMAMILIGLLALLRDLGTMAAVIQRPHPSADLLSSLFWLNLFIGLSLMLLTVALAPAVAGLFGEPRLTALVKTLSLTFILSSASTMPQSLAERSFEYARLARVETYSASAAAVVAIAAAASGLGVWSLVWQALTSTGATTILLWTSRAWRPRFVFRWAEIKSIRNFGLNLTAFNVLNYFARNADNFLIGKLAGARELGFYALAYRLMLFPLQSVSDVLGRVTFSAYSRIESHEPRLRHAYLRVVSLISLVTFPLSLGLLVTCDLVIDVAFGPRWRPAVPLLVALAPLGIAQSVGATVGAIYLAKGRTDLLLRWGLVAGALITAGFVLGVRWGAFGVAVSYTLTSLVLFVPGLLIPFRLIGLQLSDLAMVLWRPFLSSVVMASVVLVLRIPLGPSPSSLVALATLVSLGMLTYGLLTLRLSRDDVASALRLVRGAA